MERAASRGQSTDQAASPTPVLGIVLQDFSLPERCQDLIQTDLLYDHLLLSMLCDPKDSGSRLGFYSREECFKRGRIVLPHPIISVSRLPCPGKPPECERLTSEKRKGLALGNKNGSRE